MKKIFLGILALMFLWVAPAFAINLVTNAGCTGTAYAPWSWTALTTDSGPNTATYRSSPESWKMPGGQSAIYQDISSGFSVGDIINFYAYMYNPASAPLGNNKKGKIKVEFYTSGGVLISSYASITSINQNSATNTWTQISGTTTVPATTATIRLRIYAYNTLSFFAGTGQFFVDDVSLTAATPTATATPTYTITATHSPTPTSSPTYTSTTTSSPTITSSPTTTSSPTLTPTATPFSGSGILVPGNIITTAGYFGCTLTAQGTTLPSVATGGFGFWINTDDSNKLYLFFNTGGGYKKVQLQ